jgi:DNA modification methylase
METEEIALSRVSENEANPRTITEANFQKLVKSILVFPKMLQLRPIVVDETYKALGGNMRTRALCHIVSMTPEAIMDVLDTDKRLTDSEKRLIAYYWSLWKEQPTATIVKASDLTEAQKKEFIIKDNAGFGDWDTEALANQWNTDLLKDWGIQDWQLQGWVSPDSLKNGEQADDDQKEAKDDEFDEETEKIPQRCKECELWQLGKHRLMCGDSTDAEQVKFLMGGQVVNLYLTDPPYNVGYGYEGSAMMSGKRKHRTDGMTVKNDKMDNDKFRDFLSAAFLAAEETMEKGAAFYIFYSGNYSMWFREALMSTKDLELRQTLIWNKDSLCLGRQDYQWKHEPCLYGWKNGGAHNWFNDRAQTTVIDMARPKVSREHPTMKPVPLFAYLMGNSTKEGWNVYDGFGGSGTTLIAAEQLNRNAFLMELDPHYCDVIIARWEKLTGEKAVKIDEFKKHGE